MTRFSQDEIVERAFLRVARIMFEMWEEDRAHTGLLDNWLIHDDWVVAGVSRNGRGRREHVVPRLLIYVECQKKFAAGVSVEEVAKFIRRNLRIVHISREEQHHLDNVLGLKTDMPQGWSFEEGDPFARLIVAGIEWNRPAARPQPNSPITKDAS